jgi:F-type H+-transporting ATPase subunit b
MQLILNQLGDLLLGSVPTVLFFLILLAAYQVLVRKPLEKVLTDRYGRTGGAMDEARAAIAAAEQKTADYEARLRAARAELFEARATRQKAATDARDRVLTEARAAAGQRIAAARESVERTGAEARAEIEAGAAALSQRVLAAILPHRAGTETGAAQ